MVAHAAKTAGWEIHIIDIDQLFWDAKNRIWHDADRRRVRNLFKLYPWEDMVSNEYGKALANGDYEAMDNWFEPAWKMFLSNKILLVALWELFPHHPLLVPAYLDSPRAMRDWVKKPLFGREGDGIVINAPSFDVHVEHTDGYISETATEEEYIYQAYVQAPNYLGDKDEPNHPLLGAWVVDAESVAFAMREADEYITDYYPRHKCHQYRAGWFRHQFLGRLLLRCWWNQRQLHRYRSWGFERQKGRPWEFSRV